MMEKTGKSAALAAILGSAMILSSCDLDGLVLHDGDLKPKEKAVMGLRVALKAGIDSGSGAASKFGGYLANKAIQIPLPEEAKLALATAESIASYVEPFKERMSSFRFLFPRNHEGMESNNAERNLGKSLDVLSQISNLEGLGDSLIKYMNRAAELAAPRSVPIFKDAIMDMAISDGLSLLNSPDSTAAAGYLSAKTFDSLAAAYSPLVDSALNLVPLAKHWEDFRNAFGQLLNSYYLLMGFQNSWNRDLPTTYRVNILKSFSDSLISTESLGQWTTEKALVGLFFLVGEEEKNIRRDPSGYAKGLAADDSEIIMEVFGDIMEMGK